MRKVIIAIVVVLTSLFAVAAVGLFWFEYRWLPTVFAKDAVQVIAYTASDMFQSNPATTHDDIQQMIKSQHEASNINLKTDPNGKAVDPFGSAFRVDHKIQSGMSVITVVSAGPDRQFGTEDDIQFIHKQTIE